MTGGVNGTVMSGVPVTLYASDGTTVATTTTNADGSYNFVNNLTPGTTYIVKVSPPAGYENVAAPMPPHDGRTTVTVRLLHQRYNRRGFRHQPATGGQQRRCY